MCTDFAEFAENNLFLLQICCKRLAVFRGFSLLGLLNFNRKLRLTINKRSKTMKTEKSLKIKITAVAIVTALAIAAITLLAVFLPKRTVANAPLKITKLF